MIKTGDTVWHRPSGEKWIVAWADDTELIACGWPEALAHVSDCQLLRSCTQEESYTMMRSIAKLDGERGARCRQALLAAPCPFCEGAD